MTKRAIKQDLLKTLLGHCYGSIKGDRVVVTIDGCVKRGLWRRIVVVVSKWCDE